MINSIEFFDKENGYLNKKAFKYVLKDGYSEEDYIEAKKNPSRFRSKVGYGRSIKDHFYNEIENGYENDRARNCLLGRKFVFSGDKINLIFGPNASGKSTIINTIANYTLCGSNRYFDGFTNITKFEPLNYPLSFGTKENKYTKENLIQQIELAAGNKAKVEWDGNPVYYHAFEKRQSIMSVDDIEDNIIGGMADQLSFMMNKKSLSDGKQSIYIFSCLFDIAKYNPSFEDIINLSSDKLNNYNDTWKKCFDNTLNYINEIYCGERTQNTILLDEIDKSLDINNIAWIFKELLPKLKETNNQQIIVISHSPLVLSETICSPDIYNLISMDEDYTNNVKNLLSSLKF